MLWIMLPASFQNATVNAIAGAGERLPSAWPSWMATAREEGEMFASHATGQEIEHVRVLLMLIAATTWVFWRVALRVLLPAIVIGTAAFLLLQGMHR